MNLSCMHSNIYTMCSVYVSLAIEKYTRYVLKLVGASMERQFYIFKM